MIELAMDDWLAKSRKEPGRYSVSSSNNGMVLNCVWHGTAHSFHFTGKGFTSTSASEEKAQGFLLGVVGDYSAQF